MLCIWVLQRRNSDDGCDLASTCLSMSNVLDIAQREDLGDDLTVKVINT